MEVYSIINDLDEIEHQPQNRMIQQAFARNRYLLRRYAHQFKNSSPRQFRNQVRTVLKQIRSFNIKQTPRYSSKEFFQTQEQIKAKRRSQVVLPLKYNNNSNSGHQSCQNITRMSVFRSVENIEKVKFPDRNIVRLSKRSMGQLESWKIKKISLGEDLQQNEDKIRLFLNHRYKTTLVRLKILYNNPRQLGGYGNKPTYFINNSLAEYISKNLVKN